MGLLSMGGGRVAEQVGGGNRVPPPRGERVRMQSHLKHSRTRLMFHLSSGLSHCRFRRPAEKRKALNAYKKLPLSFIPNESQTDEAVRYYAQGAGYIPSDLVVTGERHSRLGGGRYQVSCSCWSFTVTLGLLGERTFSSLGKAEG